MADSSREGTSGSRTFDDLFQESSQAQRKFAARVTVFGEDEALTSARYPIPKHFGKYDASGQSESESAGKAEELQFERDRPPESPPKAPQPTYNEYEDILRDDWQPNLGPPNAPKLSQGARNFFDLGPKKFEVGEERDSETFVNPVSTHVNPLSSSGGGPTGFAALVSSAKKASSAAKRVLTGEEEAEVASGSSAEADARPAPSAGGWKTLQRQWQFTQQLQKNRTLAVNAALLSDYRIANIRVLSMQLFRSLDKEEFGFVTYDHVRNMKSAVWGWRGGGTAAKTDVEEALTAGEGGSSGVDDIRDTLIVCLQRGIKYFKGKITVDEFVWYIVNVGIPQPYNSVDLHHALTKATSVMSASPSCEPQYGVAVVPGLMLLNAVVTCVLTYHVFIDSVPKESDYFADGKCSAEGRWIDFSKLPMGSIGSGKIDALTFLIPGILAIIHVALVAVMFVLPKCKRKVYGVTQDFQDTTEHKEVRKDLAQIIVVENDGQHGVIGMQKTRSLVFAVFCGASVLPLLLLVLALGGLDKELTNDYHTLYLLCASYVVVALVMFIRALACVKPVGPDALVAIHRDRNLLLSYPVVLPYDPDLQNALDVWMRVEESLGRTDSFFTKDAGAIKRTCGSRIVALTLCLAFALSPLAMLLIQPGTCFGRGGLDHPIVTILLAIVLAFAGLVLVSDLFDIAAIHRKKTKAFKTLGSLLVAKEAVEAKIPYLSAAASPQNLAAFTAMKNYLLSHYLIGDAVQTGRDSRSIGWAVSETLVLHFVFLILSIFSAFFEWRITLYFSICILTGTSYFLLGFNSTGSFSAAISLQRCLARLTKVLLGEASKMQVSSYNIPSDQQSVRYPVEYLQNTVRALELTAKSFEVMPEQRPRSVGITLSDLSISLLRVFSLAGVVASIVIASLVY
ncbi:hypothetical protein HOP50_04g33260 [Chloropicon primus]|uniref:Uncharacterized protein n=1 Tax=Chloropicon primus TaxID=1764295 RepID=A0A5B8MMB8_9CHLO|nr:hypothetical protein A3770_04p33230 [Chloropicon primus]UPR00017.1 hypothetical protein HOP50_04g33260 [Chloropicon primus]|eukprot:QDZ20805.1 hypothetical protein A3770_04p33230 [Chloropicon primus]